KLPLSILTNFAEFAVYDCRIKPAKTDNAAHARILYLTYTEYLARWDELIGIFSREAILKGAFDKYIDSKSHKKGTAEVDSAFLSEIERWRDMLARNIALRNPVLTSRQLNFAVQQTIDRIIFLRICEDRGIEDYGRFLALQNGPKIDPLLFQRFQEADERYNSGLFHFQAEKQRDNPDTLTPTLVIDDKILKDILKSLYYPDSPYEFSVLPADILGQVYEQFLGQVIRPTPAHRAVIEQKPEVKKAGGVYYTPTYIVDYIVKQTVGPLVHNQKPNQVSHLTILDPACGSGSFLLGAYQFLLDWHSEYYQKNPAQWAKGKNPCLYQTSGGTWQLTLPERKRILLNNLYGIDIDPQAVEVTKLSLLLKVLENEQNLFPQLSLWKERVLPDLDKNIKCGNSLISTDFYQGQQLGLLDEETLYRINAFDWENEFSQIMKMGGFDAVIGNPPYVRQELLRDWKSYFQDHYQSYHGVADLYVYFIEKGLSLLRDKGRFSIIVANKWMRAHYGKPLRQFLSQQQLTEITDFGDLPVFQKATTYPCILGIQKQAPQTTFQVTQIKTLDFSDLKTYTAKKSYTVQQSALEEKGWVLVDNKTQALLDKLHQMGVPLNQYVNGKIYRGVLTGFNDAFVIDAETREKLIAEDLKSEELIKPFLQGRDIKRYQPLFVQRYLIF
ncbi:MAG: N-6 DNA methylase, partial [Candidatus Parabeggiatoa sp.]|nr:N-6 DNA methylase [Candidatus Parabeggiatoa sp.]